MRHGKIAAQLWAGDGPVKVSNGLIHDWTGAAFIRGATVEQTLTLVQNYDNHKNIYQPEVIDSKLISHHGNNFKISLRLAEEENRHQVTRTPITTCITGNRAWAALFCRSYTTRIAEVEDAGTDNEHVLDPDTGYGFLWRLYSYWKFDEKSDERRSSASAANGVYIECRAISLTRDIPYGLGWIIEPIIRSLPQESLIHTLECTRKALT